ncbi:MAG: pyruvate kinase [Verrucomicrobia bacterium]|nr:MAG: pyruvate kinase [Verrucomicrobiota bacterium]
MSLPAHKTKLVATIGPASRRPETLEALIRAGMGIARLNFSHGTFEQHQATARAVRAAAERVGRPVTLLADLPGPKLRIGELRPDPLELRAGDTFVLTPGTGPGGPEGASVDFPDLPRVLRPGSPVYLNDGLVRLRVERIEGTQVRCRVEAGGELRSRKGLNLPELDDDVPAFTAHDRECLRCALEAGIEAVSQSFVSSAADIAALRQTARQWGANPFVIAKIERAPALRRLDAILEAADGLMVARGDLGVETPIEELALLQKRIVAAARQAGKPVIVATQMLESMTQSPQPTRAEATDVANAVLDGADALMLSAETAVGRFPVEAVATLARIAAATEPHRETAGSCLTVAADSGDRPPSVADLLAAGVESILERAEVAAVVVPTRSGATARSLARFRLPVWIAAFSPDAQTCAGLQFSYGVMPRRIGETGAGWDRVAADWVKENRLAGRLVLLVQGPSALHPERHHCIELIETPSPGTAPRPQ